MQVRTIDFTACVQLVHAEAGGLGTGRHCAAPAMHKQAHAMPGIMRCCQGLHVVTTQSPAAQPVCRGIRLPPRCAICQLDYEPSDMVKVLPCRHCYHPDCVGAWLADNKVRAVMACSLGQQQHAEGQRHASERGGWYMPVVMLGCDDAAARGSPRIA